ncbi:hypothetical protein [Bradyrhizobium mercantei]|uniref:hypothetical protein n=1 Tax=Bradyrhizobium mercantei TaxID=1904807 RepID=UPI00117733A5|nr:hypothetical protein [Bradyrhizobium mercantei]
MPYHIRSTDEFVEAWTSWHVNFSAHSTNTKEDDQYRKELRDGIQHLAAGVGLNATYTCQEWPRNRDVENLLLYNPRISSEDFGNRQCLRFEKRTAAKLQPCPQLPDAYVRYEVSKQIVPFKGDTLAECAPVACQKIDLQDPGRLWKVLKGANWHTSERGSNGAELKVDLVVWAPEKVNLVGRIKTILDGFLSSLHHRSESDHDLEDVVERLVMKYRWQDRQEVRRLLIQNEYAVLGKCHTPKCHIRSKPGSLMWSPDDHRLSHCQVVYETSPDWRIEGRLFL